MALTFDKIPSTEEIKLEQQQEPAPPTVCDELAIANLLLEQRTTDCKSIKPLYKPSKTRPRFTYRFVCFCPPYRPHYPCKHAGNVIIDRDVLTKEEHICYLSTPRENMAYPRKSPRYYSKRAVLPACTARIQKLALPHLRRVEETLHDYQHLLSKRQRNALKKQLAKQPEVTATTVATALELIEEERRLERVAKNMRKRECKRLKKHILRKQQKQIKQIICVLFEEMKDFLLNDQFLVDERSTLCAVILEQIRNFTDKEFYTTSNLREYQQILANNLTVWINKFISNLNIHLAPPPPPPERMDPDAFLPVKDYISCSESAEDETVPTGPDFYYGENSAEEDISPLNYELQTEETMINTNP